MYPPNRAKICTTTRHLVIEKNPFATLNDNSAQNSLRVKPIGAQSRWMRNDSVIQDIGKSSRNSK